MSARLGERHAARFAVLTPEQCALVWRRVRERLPACECDPRTGAELMAVCSDHQMDHAAVVLCVSAETDPVGRGAIAALVGRPIVPWVPQVVLPPGPRPVRPRARS